MIEIIGKTSMSISAGGSHTIVLMTDGSLYGTGNNNNGQLGLGNNTTRYTLMQITELDGKTPLSISAGNRYTMVLMTDGSLYGTGRNDTGQLGLGNNDNVNVLTQITGLVGTPSYVSSGGSHTIIIINSSIYGTGSNSSGQLGLNNNDDVNQFTICIGLVGTSLSILSGFDYTIVLMTNGSLYGTGDNYYGQLGRGNNNDVIVFT
jgi:hypothetical protein